MIETERMGRSATTAMVLTLGVCAVGGGAYWSVNEVDATMTQASREWDYFMDIVTPSDQTKYPSASGRIGSVAAQCLFGSETPGDVSRVLHDRYTETYTVRVVQPEDVEVLDTELTTICIHEQIPEYPITVELVG